MQTLEASKLKEFCTHLPENGGMLPESIKNKGLEALNHTDFPTTRVERWKYTRVGKIANKSLQIHEANHVSSNDNENIIISFVNGQLVSDLPSVEGVTIQTIDQASSSHLGQNLSLDNEAFHAINTGYAAGGVYIHVNAKADIAPTIHLAHTITQSESLAAIRHLIVVEKEARVNIIQSFNTEDNAHSSLSLPITEVFVGENAQCSIEKLQQENDETFHIATEQVAQEQNSTFTIRTITLNGNIVRNNLNIEVNGENCETNLYGGYITKGKQHIDNHTVVDHKVANCESNELYKGVMDEKSTAVFNGKVFVRKDAQKINAFQSNGNVLLSDDATINSKPELEIYADDVKCSHGSTTGQLDDEAIFYLRARGLSERSAKQLLIHAFVGEVIEAVQNDYLKKEIQTTLTNRFGWHFDEA